MPTLYHGRTSVCSLKARLALAEKALNFDSRLLTPRGDQFEPQYLKLNPNAVVPTLVHDDSVIIESTVIMHYVDDAFPGAALMPQDLLARAIPARRLGPGSGWISDLHVADGLPDEGCPVPRRVILSAQAGSDARGAGDNTELSTSRFSPCARLSYKALSVGARCRLLALSNRPASCYHGRYRGKSGHRARASKATRMTHFDRRAHLIAAAQNERVASFR